MSRSKVGGHAPAHALPSAKGPRFARGTALVHAARDRARSVDTEHARRAMSQLSQWPVPADGARLPTADDMLAPRSVWERAARLTLTPAFGVAAATYVMCVWIVIGSANTPDPADQLTTASEVGPADWAVPPEGLVRPGPLPRAKARVVGPPVEQIDQGFLAGLQNVLNGIDSQPGQPKPYQPDLPAALPVIDPALTPVLDPLAPVPPEVLAPPLIGPDGRPVEAPIAGTPVPLAPGVVPPTPGVAPTTPAIAPSTSAVAPTTPAVTPEAPAAATPTPAVTPSTTIVTSPTPAVTPQAPVAVSEAPTVASEAPAAAPVSPTVVAPSAQTPTTAGQQPLGPPPGPAA